MVEEFKGVWALKEEKDIIITQAAYMISVKKVAETMKLRDRYIITNTEL